MNYPNKNDETFQYILEIYRPNSINNNEYKLVEYEKIVEEINYFCLDEEIDRIYKTYMKINKNQIKKLKEMNNSLNEIDEIENNLSIVHFINDIKHIEEFNEESDKEIDDKNPDEYYMKTNSIETAACKTVAIEDDPYDDEINSNMSIIELGITGMKNYAVLWNEKIEKYLADKYDIEKVIVNFQLNTKLLECGFIDVSYKYNEKNIYYEEDIHYDNHNMLKYKWNRIIEKYKEGVKKKYPVWHCWDCENRKINYSRCKHRESSKKSVSVVIVLKDHLL